MIQSNFPISCLSQEMEKARFKDRRLSRRLVSFVEAIAAKPSEGFPQVLEDPSDLEGWYRFLSNPKVTMERILRPHFEATRRRVQQAEICLAIHDTSVFCFEGDAPRDGLCRITKQKQGFFGHFTLAASLDSEVPTPLGLLSVRTFLRRDKGSGTRRKGKKAPPSTGERRRWFQAAHEVSHYVGKNVRLIHVMDREADSYEIISELFKRSERFVIRVFHDRKLSGEDDLERYSSKLKTAPILCQREVELSPRRQQHFPSARKRLPERKARKAKLSISAVPVELPGAVSVTLVHVKEVDCPDDSPVEWFLLTSEKVTDSDTACTVVDIYRRRWLIEEFFKALKTGCAFEKRQLESRNTLENALAALSPVAWRLLLLRCLSRTHPNAPATAVLTSEQIALLQAYPKVKLQHNPTVEHAIKAIARLGGHIKNNGPPGWIVLGRGYDKLLWMVTGWRAAHNATGQRCDQS